ncbi:MAG: TetR family transcriptional regulator [Acidimicrobiia bacterium]|nr:TetR family transcriptional regulator [Acidimicrobiia bacterium]
MSESLREQRRQLERDQRRADIVSAASRLFGEKGYDGTQIAEIATAAEVSLASLYSLFEGKEEIYQAAIESAAESIEEAARDKVEPLDDPAERLLTLVDSLFDCFEQNRDLLRIYTRSTGGLPWRLRHTMGDSSVAIFQRFTGWVVALSRQAQTAGYLQGLDAEVFSLTLIGSVTTTAAFAIERAPEEPLSRAAPAARAICKRLLLGEAAG